MTLCRIEACNEYSHKFISFFYKRCKVVYLYDSALSKYFQPIARFIRFFQYDAKFCNKINL